MYTLEDESSVANFITDYEESQENRNSHFLSVMCSLFLKATFQIFICTDIDTTTKFITLII